MAREVTHPNIAKAEKTAEQQLAEAVDHERFMVLALYVDENGVVKLKRTCWNFPHDMFGEVVAMIAKQLCGELYSLQAPVAKYDPLPVADLKPLGVASYDGGEEDADEPDTDVFLDGQENGEQEVAGDQPST